MSLELNTKVKTRNGERIYCQESYAQELYELYAKSGLFGDTKIPTKDLQKGAVYKVKVVGSSSDGKIIGQTESGQSIFLDIKKEAKFINDRFLISEGLELDVLVDSIHRNNYYGSIEKGFYLKIKESLQQSLKDNKSAYSVKIKSINNGGFMVDLSGIECFMPGSLAAPNKIIDFESMVGKEVYVMVENYLEKSDMFIVSVKKYIQSIIPFKIKELDLSKKYSGIITGSTSFGTFVEWDDMFTGLIHESEFKNGNTPSRPGSAIEFWIKEVKDNNRIILTLGGPNPDNILFQTFKDECEGEVLTGVVKDIKPFGIFVELEEGITGMLQPREVKKTGKLKIGDDIDVLVKQVDIITRKIFLKSSND